MADIVAQARLWLCRHGDKESEGGEVNWQLMLLPEGIENVQETAKRLASLHTQPRRIVCSPFPRCVATAGIYARILGIPSICVEPALCEVLTPGLGAKGLTAPPRWTETELLGHLAASGSDAVRLNADYAPVVTQEDLRMTVSDSDRVEANERIAGLKNSVVSGVFFNDLLVTHGFPCKHLVRLLTAHKNFQEPAMGSAIELVANENMSASAPAQTAWGSIVQTIVPIASGGAIVVEDDIPSASLVGGMMEMQCALKQYAEDTDQDYATMKALHEQIVFQVSRKPVVPAASPDLRFEALQKSSSVSGRVFLAPVVHVQTPEQAVRNARIAVESGADGVFLINHGHGIPAGSDMDVTCDPKGNPAPCTACPGPDGDPGRAQLIALAECFRAVREALGPNVWLGVNAIQLDAKDVCPWIAKECPSANAVWVDDFPIEPAHIEWETVGFGSMTRKLAVRNLGWRTLEDQTPGLQFMEQRRQSGWTGLVFGGVAYKYMPYRCHHDQDAERFGVACQSLLSHWGSLASHFCDVLITSGSGTGTPCYPMKLKAFADSRPLAFSGGPSSGETVVPYAEAADVVLAATAIGRGEPGSEDNFLQLDDGKVKAWLQAYRDASS